MKMPEGRRQKAEGRRQKAEGRRQFQTIGNGSVSVYRYFPVGHSANQTIFTAMFFDNKELGLRAFRCSGRVRKK
jgi:hypothetical protein